MYIENVRVGNITKLGITYLSDENLVVGKGNTGKTILRLQ
jgi:hypothetical protein